MVFVLGLLKPFALKILAGLAMVAAVLAAFYSTKQAGRMAERADRARKTAEVQREMLREAARRPTGKRELADRLRGDDF